MALGQYVYRSNGSVPRHAFAQHCFAVSCASAHAMGADNPLPRGHDLQQSVLEGGALRERRDDERTTLSQMAEYSKYIVATCIGVRVAIGRTPLVAIACPMTPSLLTRCVAVTNRTGDGA